MPRNGSIAIAKMTIPTPPRPLRIARHNKKDRGKASISAKTVAPVVLMPDAASKTASAPEIPYNIKGIAASSVTENQLMTVSRYACCKDMFFILLLLAKNKDSPIKTETIDEVINKDHLAWL